MLPVSQSMVDMGNSWPQAHHITCKRKAETSSQSIIFPAYLPTPHQFQCCLAQIATMNHYTCRIWLSTLDLLFSITSLHQRRSSTVARFGSEIGGGGPSVVSLSSVVGVKKDKVRHPGNWSRPCKVPEMGARSLWRWRKI